METKASFTAFLFWSLFGLYTSLYRVHTYVSHSYKWKEAQDYCKRYWDDLSIFNKDELKPYSDNLQGTANVWIGLFRDPQYINTWRWVNGQGATDLSWDGGEPSSLSEKCAGVRLSSAKLHDLDCNTLAPFYCMNVFELVIVQQESTWEEAWIFCEKNYISLAVLSSELIMKEAMEKSTTAKTKVVWIGLGFLAGQWFWVNGEGVGYMVWSSAQLQCPAMNQRCGVYDVQQQVWKSADCEERLNFLCVKKSPI
ncbi:hypothetical protein DNTS_007742 [Danionella cerebrum]|uniref:C-type lectin domain-containing protein n=1 Tax=Danionella cerebrum TaxID=2873325 RepID=A0A553RDX9_9TELE|nr:hypothetical protein DNTS_007742 [Danionella translucida]